MKDLFENKQVVKATLSGAKTGKLSIRAISEKGKFYYHISKQVGTKEFHENLPPEEIFAYLEPLLPQFKQGHIYTHDTLHHYLWSSKGKETHLVKAIASESKPHNLLKKRALTDLPILADLGIKKDKLVQIDKFIEIVGPYLEGNVVDFGCGKAYLTFALAHLFKIDITGFDLKEDVLEKLQKLAEKHGYKNIHFEVGSTPKGKVDAILALHACNTATDEAIFKGIELGAKLIVVAPCCHQELYKQIESEDLKPILKHGILKERLASLATDAARAELLNLMGYKTDCIEFIDYEHTPKNLLIRAVKVDRPKKVDPATYRRFCESLHIHPRLEVLLKKGFVNH